MRDDYQESHRKSNRNFWIGIVALLIVGAIVPERYSILVFLGAIWIILFEISDRLRTHFYYHKRIAGAIEELANVSHRD